MGCKLWINKGHIYLSLCYNGQRWRESTGLTVSSNKAQNKEVMKVAEIMRSNREIEIATNQANIQKKSNLTLYEYCIKYAQTDKHKSACKCLFNHGGNEIKLTAVNSRWLEKFTKAVEEDNTGTIKKTSSMNTYISFVRTCLVQAYKDNIINKNPCIGVKNVRIIKTEKPYLTVEEVKKLIDTPIVCCRPSIKPGFLLACFTGLRYSDVRSLNVTDIKEGFIIKTMEKTERPVKIPLNEMAINILNQLQPDNEGFYFPELKDLKKLGYTEKMLKSWVKAAGLEKNVSWHIARHTHAVLLLEAGADLYTVQKLLGHTQIQTTQVYADLTDNKRATAETALSDKFKS